MSTSWLYRIASRVTVSLLPLATPFNDKLRRGVEGRRGSVDRLRDWAERWRTTERPLVWFHAPSVGEGLQAAPVITRLRRRHPEWQLGYTYFSPSAEAWAGTLNADVADYLPYDRPAEVGAALDALAPAALVFTKLDLWPELVAQAVARNIPVGLIAGTVSKTSGRGRWPVREVLRPAYAALTRAGAVSATDAEHLASLSVPRDRIEVLGDPRYDSVRERWLAFQAVAMGSAPAGDPCTLVAGSTWPADENVLLDALVEVRKQRPDAKLLLAPHEPTPEHLERVERAAARRGLPVPRRLKTSPQDWQILLVDRIGVLAQLYGAGGAAYVGGGFGRAGLHSVLEPSAWGIPVCFGPRWRGSRDAGLLLEAGAAMALPARPDGAATVLAERWREWLEDQGQRIERGRRARGVLEAGLGAADRCTALVEGLVRQRT
ncbi:MAG TPA: glycosyltransferase N-terminal domain-containing protein [Gemmatimonadales bacterium]